MAETKARSRAGVGQGWVNTGCSSADLAGGAVVSAPPGWCRQRGSGRLVNTFPPSSPLIQQHTLIMLCPAHFILEKCILRFTGKQDAKLADMLLPSSS